MKRLAFPKSPLVLPSILFHCKHLEWILVPTDLNWQQMRDISWGSDNSRQGQGPGPQKVWSIQQIGSLGFAFAVRPGLRGAPPRKSDLHPQRRGPGGAELSRAREMRVVCVAGEGKVAAAVCFS